MKNRPWFRSLLAETFLDIDRERLFKNDPEDLKFKYYLDLRTLLVGFLGLPFNKRFGSTSKWLKWTDFLKNMVSWDSYAPRWLRVVNYMLAPLMFIYHVLLAPIKLALNVLKIVTELLPHVLADLFMGLKDYSKKVKRQGDSLLSENEHSVDPKLKNVFLPNLGLFLGHVLGALFTAFHLAGRAVTSPVKSAKFALSYGVKQQSTLLAVVLFAVSIATSTVFFVYAFPFALQALAGLVAPYMPAILTEAANMLASNVLGPLGSLVTNFIVKNGAALYAGIAPAMVGMAGLAMLQVPMAMLIGVKDWLLEKILSREQRIQRESGRDPNGTYQFKQPVKNKEPEDSAATIQKRLQEDAERKEEQRKQILYRWRLMASEHLKGVGSLLELKLAAPDIAPHLAPEFYAYVMAEMARLAKRQYEVGMMKMKLAESTGVDVSVEVKNNVAVLEKKIEQLIDQAKVARQELEQYYISCTSSVKMFHVGDLELPEANELQAVVPSAPPSSIRESSSLYRRPTAGAIKKDNSDNVLPITNVDTIGAHSKPASLRGSTGS